MKSFLSLFALILGGLNVVADAQTREEKVRDDRQRVVSFLDLQRSSAGLCRGQEHGKTDRRDVAVHSLRRMCQA